MPLILGLEPLGKSYNARYDQLLLVWALQSFGKVQRRPRKATTHVGFAVGMSTLCAMPGHSWRSCLKRLRLCEQVGWGRSQGISRVGEQCQSGLWRAQIWYLPVLCGSSGKKAQQSNSGFCECFCPVTVVLTPPGPFLKLISSAPPCMFLVPSELLPQRWS